MTLDEIINDVDDLDKRLSDKGWKSPKCSFEYDGQHWYKVQADNPISGGDWTHEFFHGDNALSDARQHIAGLPTAENAAKDDFRKALGRLIDKGNSLGIETDFLNPLTEQMRRLSENVVTAQ